MKKTIFLTQLITFIVLIVVGCSTDNEPFTQKSYTADAAQISEININVRDRELDVTRSNDNQIHINYSENSKEAYDISVSDNNTLTMTAENNKNAKDYVGGKPSANDRKISLQLPDNVLNALSLSTTNEKITLDELSAINNISLSSNGGDISFNNLNSSNTITLNAKNGNISGTIIGGYDDYAINCDIKKGKTNLPANKKDGDKTLNVSNNNGNIDIEFIKK